MTARFDVVVVGGGYAGVIAANHLRTRSDVNVTLINPRPQFVERIRLHQLVAGSDDAVAPYTHVLGAGVTLMVDSVEHVDADAREVALASGRTICYDYLVYAVGSTDSAPRPPGAAEHAHVLADLEHATSLRTAVAALPARSALVVVGAGPTGIETAAELGEQGYTVTLVCGDVLGPYLSGLARNSVAKQLRRRGVTVLAGPGATVAEVRPTAVRLCDGREVSSAATIWTAGFGVPDLAARSGLTTDGIGRLLTDETLTSVDSPFVVAAGDAAAPSGVPLRMSCQAAIPLGAQAANTVLSRIAGREPAVLNQAFTGQCISLGRTGGAIQVARPDDSVLPFYLGGRAAAAVKETVCRGTIFFLAREARRPGSYFWLKGGNRARQVAKAHAAVR